ALHQDRLELSDEPAERFARSAGDVAHLFDLRRPLEAEDDAGLFGEDAADQGTDFKRFVASDLGRRWVDLELGLSRPFDGTEWDGQARNGRPCQHRID